jgi:hypothetical protein
MATYSTTSTWNDWTGGYDASTSSGNYTVWTTWTSTTSGTTSTATNGTWRYWTADQPIQGTITVSGETVWTSWETQVEETREQKRARLAQDAINAQKIKDVEADRKEAELTAQELLKDLISEEEMKIYTKTGRVLVKGNKSDYILTKGYQAQVVRVQKGKVVDLVSYRGKVEGENYCVHPVDQHKLPDTDKIIAMKVALESEECRIMKMANLRGIIELDLSRAA